MPATLQKTIDKTLDGCKSYFAFLDDILVATKGKLKELEETLDIILNKLDIEGMAISLRKWELAKPTIEWPGFKITPHGVTSLISKTEALQKLDPPITPRSFMGSIHHLIKFIPNLAEMSEPLHPLLKKETQLHLTNLIGRENIQQHSQKSKKQKSKTIEYKHFDVEKETRVKCDASNVGLGAYLEKKQTISGKQ